MPTLPKRTKRRAYQPEPLPKQFGNDAYPFYNSQAWRGISRRHRMNNPMCEVFPDLPAQVVDHIVPIAVDSNGRPLPTAGAALDELNLMSMSHKAHNIKRGKESHGFVVESVVTMNGLIPKRRVDVVEALRKGGGL